MSTLHLVQCVGKKADAPCAAKDLYVSPWFKKARRYVEKQGGPWFILSAQHGLVAPDQVVEPYNRTLSQMTAGTRKLWAEKTAAELASELRARNPKRLVVLAGELYREFLAEPVLEDLLNIGISTPMEDMGIGEQLRWLTEQLGEVNDGITRWELSDEVSRVKLSDLCRQDEQSPPVGHQMWLPVLP